MFPVAPNSTTSMERSLAGRWAPARFRHRVGGGPPGPGAAARPPDWPGRRLLGCPRTREDDHAPGTDGRAAGPAGPPALATSPAWSRRRQRTDDPEPSYTRLIRRMGQDGWLGLGWPVEFGGQGRGPIDQMIFVEESHWAGVPLPLLTLNSVGPTLMALGTDEQKERILPGILRGRGPLLHRLHRAHRRHRPGLPADPGRAGRRRVRDHRREALHQRHPVRRLRVAGGPDRPGRPQAQGPLGVHRPHRRRRASTGRRCAPWPASSPAPPSTTRSGCRRPTWWARRTRGGS